jgi:hypothetical protein
MSHLLHLKPCMSSSWLSSHDGTTLLSVAGQALLLLSLLCAYEDLPPSDDADEGYQWEVLTANG